LEGDISGKNYKGRPWMKYIGQIMKDVKTKSYVGMKRLAENREGGELVQTNPWSDD
jgi:hypothetical protein